MTEILNTTLAEAGPGTVVTPSDEFRLQVISAAPAAELPYLVIDVEASVEASGDYWSPIYSWRLTEGAVKRFAKQTRVRVRIRGNKAGNTISVRASE